MQKARFTGTSKPPIYFYPHRGKSSSVSLFITRSIAFSCSSFRTSRLWRCGSTHEHITPYLRRHALLDESRSYSARRIRLEGRHVESRDHGNRDGQGRTTPSGISSHARFVFDPQGKATGARGSVLCSVQGLCFPVPDQGSSCCKFDASLWLYNANFFSFWMYSGLQRKSSCNTDLFAVHASPAVSPS